MPVDGRSNALPQFEQTLFLYNTNCSLQHTAIWYSLQQRNRTPLYFPSDPLHKCILLHYFITLLHSQPSSSYIAYIHSISPCPVNLLTSRWKQYVTQKHVKPMQQAIRHSTPEDHNITTHYHEDLASHVLHFSVLIQTIRIWSHFWMLSMKIQHCEG
jgi:hypothetical protein